MITTRPLFQIGCVHATKTAMLVISNAKFTLEQVLLRHSNGDFGDISEDDKNLNEINLIIKGRVLSSYILRENIIWIVTHIGEGTTIVLTPKDAKDVFRLQQDKDVEEIT